MADTTFIANQTLVKADWLQDVNDLTYKWKQAGAGAVTRSMQDKARDFVTPEDFGAKGDGSDDSAALQAALNTGKNVVLTKPVYYAGGLTMNTFSQSLFAVGYSRIQKNKNGPILTVTASYVSIVGVGFRGGSSASPEFTGDNVVCSGSSFSMRGCGSYWAAGRAVKSTGSHTTIDGCVDVYQTADQSASGYDIEIGVAGTSTLYHVIRNIRTSQAAGGILLVDTGTHFVSGCQFGKYSVLAGTKPAGSNGGLLTGCRVLGDVLVELSNAILTSNQFSTVTITFALGTAQHVLDQSNNLINATIVNNGNSNSAICSAAGVSAGDGQTWMFGTTAYNRKISFKGDDSSVGFEFDASCVVPNSCGFRSKDSDGTLRSLLTYTSGNNLAITGKFAVQLSIASGTGAQVTSNEFRPFVDNAYSLGVGSLRWSVVYAGTGAINTSDERAKQDAGSIPDAWLDAWGDVNWCKYKFKDAVSAKGDEARWHFGVIAQQVVAAFVARGLDPFQIGLVCFDQWDATPAEIDAEGNVLVPAVPAGDRYGIRYDEAQAIEAAWVRRELLRVRVSG